MDATKNPPEILEFEFRSIADPSKKPTPLNEPADEKQRQLLHATIDAAIQNYCPKNKDRKLLSCYQVREQTERSYFLYVHPWGDESLILEIDRATMKVSPFAPAGKPATGQAEPFMFLGVAENQSGQEGPTGTINGQASQIAKISAVAEVSWQEYLSAKQAGKIFASQEHDGYVYYAVKSLRDVRFDNASATVEITERFKAQKP